MNNKYELPDYLFEVSWEVCNKVGGIHTVIASKAELLIETFGDNYITIGPDVWRGEDENPEFIEDKGLFKNWRKVAKIDGLRIRTGRWNIPGKPIAIIVDYTPFIQSKNDIFKIMWERYSLDSISGHWDYVEPMLYGYAAGRVVESFIGFHSGKSIRSIAHFHEWMTGAGILYLHDKAPTVATLFTTHATVMGRSLAGNNQPLYEGFQNIDVESKAKELNIVSKQSLERLAAQNADVFTTVSNLTAGECEYFLSKKIDFVTPNGFDRRLVPSGSDFDTKRKRAREVLSKVAESLLGEKFHDDTVFIAHSGRYEMRNKGMDVFIDSLAKLNGNKETARSIVAFILVPANQNGPRKVLLDRLSGSNEIIQEGDNILTHYLHDSEYDPVLRLLRERGIDNSKSSKVKVIFAPCYLNGYDGIFNLSYYDLLVGMDLTVFPSYYEPWGYTPMESVAFRVPTITTSLTGYGIWIKEKYSGDKTPVKVIERDEHNYSGVVDEVSGVINNFLTLTNTEVDELRRSAAEVSEITMWDTQIVQYLSAFDAAMKNSEKRFIDSPVVSPGEVVTGIYKSSPNIRPKWKNIVVHKSIPESLSALDEISKNLWWSWNEDAITLFKDIDPRLWKKSLENPVRMLEDISYQKLTELENDSDFVNKLKNLHSRFKEYLSQPLREGAQIAYFSMEYGLHTSLPIYSGGLGVLAGDYLKEASDMGVNLVAIGLLYRYGYFRQQISSAGEQIANYDPCDFNLQPVTAVRDESGEQLMVSIALPGRTMRARIWRADVGRVPLFLLDTDFNQNSNKDRGVTHALYGGDWENRFKQELLLGIGGIRALRTLGLKPDLYHCNEGHAAFIGLERLNYYVNEYKLMFSQAIEVVRASTLFTTHTPVPAGHDSFDENLLRTYIAHYPDRLNISWTHLMNLGKIHPNDPNEKFSMSYLAANLSQEINGVSKLHGEVSRKIFSDLWSGYLPSELNIGYVTNGIHHDTWTSPEFKQFYNKTLGSDYRNNQHLTETWQKINDASNFQIWSIREKLRKDMVDYIGNRSTIFSPNSFGASGYFPIVREKLNPVCLTIGFARRFATYKRAQLLFRDIDRLNAIVNNPEMPVQFVFAGKAHPNDRAGQDVMRQIVQISKRPEFLGKVLFLENYDMDLAKMLVKGVDVWLNTPVRPMEASGTSGMKAIMNGVLNFSVIDGWWVEGYREDAGWALPQEKLYDDQEFQDTLDAETIYSILENDIAPLFYSRDENGIPTGWVNKIKKSLTYIAPAFTMRRMVIDYIERYYDKQFLRSGKLKADQFQIAKYIASWKKMVCRDWEEIEVLSATYPDNAGSPFMIGNMYTGEIVLDLKKLTPESVGVEHVLVENHSSADDLVIVESNELELIGTEGSVSRYRLLINPKKSGTFSHGIRIFPKNEELPHRQDIGLLKWI